MKLTQEETQTLLNLVQENVDFYIFRIKLIANKTEKTQGDLETVKETDVLVNHLMDIRVKLQEELHA